MLMTGMDIKVLVLDTQVYSNTGGQASGSTFRGQDTKLSFHGKEMHGKNENRKELANIAIMHPGVYVAQTTPAHFNHFYKCIMTANEYRGPALVVAYTACMPEHGIGDNAAYEHARLAVMSRAFPLFTFDPRRGDSIKKRIDLSYNPAVRDDWYVNPATQKPFDFIEFARTEKRFEKHFDKDGNPSEELKAAQADRLSNWRMLQELAGIRHE